MRTVILSALSGAALLALSTASQAMPMSASGALAGPTTTSAIDEALPDQGVTQVRWNRGHHYGWYRHPRPAYGYYNHPRYHRHHGVGIYIR